MFNFLTRVFAKKPKEGDGLKVVLPSGRTYIYTGELTGLKKGKGSF